jgi:hypothetical protein
MVRSLAMMGWLCSTRATSVEVPPMSKVMIDSNPAAPATQAAPITPALGPESSVRTGTSRAAATEMIPPLDWLMWGDTVTPRRRTSSAKRPT